LFNAKNSSLAVTDSWFPIDSAIHDSSMESTLKSSGTPTKYLECAFVESAVYSTEAEGYLRFTKPFALQKFPTRTVPVCICSYSNIR